MLRIASMIGQRLGHYAITEKLGEGGMGVVYKALDSHLDRLVAIKVLPAERVADPSRRARFVHEAKAASALNHPNIVVVHDIAVEAGRDFMVMEYVDGRTLSQLIPDGGMQLNEALAIAGQIASAIAAAHSTGIVHRDLKPANIMVDRRGVVKVLDFGLAKLIAPSVGENESTRTIEGPPTRAGQIAGTLAYMSPEQAEGKAVGAASDVFSFGAVLYEMLTGSRPFHGDSCVSVLASILRDQPPPANTLRRDLPPDLDNILARCLQKRPEARYASGRELAEAMAACCARLSAPVAPLRGITRRRWPVISAAVCLVLVLAGAASFGFKLWRANWARTVAIPQAALLDDQHQRPQAFRLLQQAAPWVAEDPVFLDLARRLMHRVSVTTTPADAEVFWKDFAKPDEPWQLLGRSPVRSALAPNTKLRWKISRQGFEDAELVSNAGKLEIKLVPLGSGPKGMIPVAGGRFQYGIAPPVQLKDFWLDRFEVSNRQFQEFVAAGGYRKREYWKVPFIENGRPLSWEDAMVRFRDTTGRAGPAGWEMGSYPEGQADYPVGGVSWYEAAAYGEFAGKSLPTVYHWFRAAGLSSNPGAMLLLSNFNGQGPALAGRFQGITPSGAYDMAGNVKEWCWNEAGASRYILGGSWRDPAYRVEQLNALSPFDRDATNGFRCVRYSETPEAALTAAAPLNTLHRDYKSLTAVNDQIYSAYRNLYSYDRASLDSRVESVKNDSLYWREEKISFNAAYGNERVIAYLYLPRNAAPPYQTVVFAPGSGAALVTSSEHLQDMPWFLPRGGRALLYPVYKGSYERGTGTSIMRMGQNTLRDVAIAQMKDLQRAVDYLETRIDLDAAGLPTGV